MLANLPLCIAGEFVGAWLDLKMLVNLDSAFCNHEFRPYFIDILASPYCTLTAKVNVFNGASVNWLVARQLKVSNLEILQNTEQASFITYLQQFGKQFGKQQDGVATLAGYTHHLTSLMCCDLLVPTSINDLLSFSSQLRELRLERVQHLHSSHFLLVELVHLRLLSLQGSTCSDKCLSAILRRSEHAQHVYLTNCRRITDAGLIAMAQTCPLLCSVGLHRLPLSDEALSELATLCPKITHLNISYNVEVTDAGVQSISQRLKYLQFLSVATCAKLTDCSLVHITENCGRTVRILNITNFQSMRVSVLTSLLKRCQKLINLVASLNIDIHCKTIVLLMHNLISLVLHSIVTDEILMQIAQHCKRLRVLRISYYLEAWVDSGSINAETASTEVLYGATEGNSVGIISYTEKGLLAVVQNLPQLRSLELMEKESPMLRVAVSLWQVQHPRLKVTSFP